MKYPAIAQPKLNGVRATLRWEKNIVQDGLFSKVVARAVIKVKSGLEYYFPNITNGISYDFFVDNDTKLEVAYDGELYLRYSFKCY